MSDHDWQKDDRRANSPEPWHLKKEVNVSLIVGLLLQAAAALWWAAGIDGRILALEKSDVEQEASLKESASASRIVADRLTRIETLLETLVKQRERN